MGQGSLSEKIRYLLACLPVMSEAIVTSDITTEWKTYRQLLLNKLEDSMKSQLKERKLFFPR